MTAKVIGNILLLLAVIAFIVGMAMDSVPNGKYYQITCSVGNTVIVEEFVYQTGNGGYKRVLNNERFTTKGTCDIVEITPD